MAGNQTGKFIITTTVLETTATERCVGDVVNPSEVFGVIA
jgi:hypothetical protein